MRKNEPISDKLMYALVEFLMKYHKPKSKDYTSKYGDIKEQTIESTFTETPKIEDSALYRELKAYRLMKSKDEGAKAYYVFTNAQMEELINKMPESLDSLKEISGFGEMKVNKYGQDLLKILSDIKNK